jgi:catechol 2,3-dioxygenase-like lactoylglutathione lyase family enzyme
MAITHLEVVSVPVTDQDRAKSFYTEKLGFVAMMDSSFAGGDMRWVMLRPPAGTTAITLVTWFDTMPAGSLRGAVLGCDDLEKTLADLEARGVAFNEAEVQEAPWGRWKTFDDPDGNGWVLQQDNPSFPA